jgi:hypothetical protein
MRIAISLASLAPGAASFLVALKEISTRAMNQPTAQGIALAAIYTAGLTVTTYCAWCTWREPVN